MDIATPDTNSISAAAALLSAFATVAAAYAAFQSAKAAHEAAKATIFKERLEVLTAFLAFHGYWIRTGKPPLGQAFENPEATNTWQQFLSAHLKAKLLFDASIQNIFKEYREMAAKYVYIESELNKNHEDNNLWEEKAKISKKITSDDEFNRIMKKFEKSMSFKI